MRTWHHVETDRGSRKRLRPRKGDQPNALFWVFVGAVLTALLIGVVAFFVI